MPILSLTPHLRDIAPSTPQVYPGATVRAVLEQAFMQYPGLQARVLDDQDRLRKHIALFIDGQLSRGGLEQAVSESCRIHVMQALSGG